MIRRAITLKHFKSLLIIVILLSFSMSFSNKSNPGVDIMEKVFTINHSLSGVKLTMLIQERTDGKLINKKTDFKILYKPYKLYLKQHYPNKGVEILYVDGTNDGKLLLHRNSKTFSNIKLNPLGNVMRKFNHHSIFRAGYSYFLEVVEALYYKYDKNNSDIWQYQGLVKYDNIVCHKIIFNNRNFRYLPYKIQDGETLESISRKFLVCDYLILEKNPEIKSFDDVKPGSDILVPSDYASQIIIYIDKDRNFPVGLKCYDDNGLFQHYTYRNFELNPVFTMQDFSRENPEYGFN